jgi:DNA-binding NarL/FixJ family response regulator
VTTASPLPTAVRRAVLVSDSPLLRAGLHALMPERGIEVVAEVSELARLKETVSRNSAQLVIAAPSDGGDDELFQLLDELRPSTAAIVLLAVPGFRIRANAVSTRFDVVCMPLNAGREELHRCIREALFGDCPEPSVQELCAGTGGTLTLREQEVLRELARGKSNKAIAETLWVSEDTVKSHLRRIYRKLDVGSRAEAVALALEQLGPPAQVSPRAAGPA